MEDLILEEIRTIIQKSIKVHQDFLNSQEILSDIQSIVELFLVAYKNNKKVLFCGNGGSAADAQHISAELSGRFHFDRPPLFAEALHVNSSYLTAVANDYSYDVVFSRLVEAKGSKGDVIVGISTSGSSKNVYNALKKAKDLGLHTISFCGKKEGKISSLSDISLNIPSDSTPRIQEIHILIGHIICELIEEGL